MIYNKKELSRSFSLRTLYEIGILKKTSINSTVIWYCVDFSENFDAVNYEQTRYLYNLIMRHGTAIYWIFWRQTSCKADYHIYDLLSFMYWWYYSFDWWNRTTGVFFFWRTWHPIKITNMP